MKIVYVLAILLYGGGVAAQTTLQVVTKSVQKSLPWKPGESLEITCEKAEVEVFPAPAGQQEISLKAELSAKHPLLDSAKYDLEAWQLATSTAGKRTYVRAYIGVGKGRRLPGSNMKVKITLWVPATCPTTLNNKFGKAKVEKITGALRLTGAFCAFNLSELGSVSVESQYGNVDARQISGSLDICTKRGDVRLRDLWGDCAIQSEFGEVRIEAGSRTGNVKVQANKSEVTVELPSAPAHDLFLTCAYGDLTLPTSPRFELDKQGNTQRAQYAKQHPKKVTVDAKFGKLTLFSGLGTN